MREGHAVVQDVAADRAGRLTSRGPGGPGAVRTAGPAAGTARSNGGVPSGVSAAVPEPSCLLDVAGIDPTMDFVQVKKQAKTIATGV